jgi:hypothetical protein
VSVWRGKELLSFYNINRSYWNVFQKQQYDETPTEMSRLLFSFDRYPAPCYPARYGQPVRWTLGAAAAELGRTQETGRADSRWVWIDLAHFPSSAY